jgi:hypothetical protein
MLSGASNGAVHVVASCWLQESGKLPRQLYHAFPDRCYCAEHLYLSCTGNHFNEWAGFDCQWGLYPSREQQRTFLHAYLTRERALQDDARPVLEEEVRLCAHSF